MAGHRDSGTACRIFIHIGIGCALGGGSMLVEHERWDFEIRENYAEKWVGLVF